MTVERLLQRERTRLGALLAARGAGAALAAAGAVVALSALALGSARWITRPALPLVAWGVVLALLAAALVWTRRALQRAAAPSRLALAIERERSLRAGALRGALEVGATGALGRRAAGALADGLAAAGPVLAPALRRRARLHGGAAALAAVLAAVLLGAARSHAPDGWRAMRHPVGAFTGTLLPAITIERAPGAVMRGETLRIRIHAPERRVVALHVRRTGTAWDTLSLPVTGDAAAAALGPLDADLTIVASDGRVSSDTVRVRVTDRPFVGDVAIRAHYPAYLARPAETIPVGEPARVPRGTMLSVSGRASTELRAVGLAAGRDSVRFEPDGHAFSGRMAALESGHFTWYAAGAAGAIPDVPAPIELEVVPDSAPSVTIVSPARDTLVLPDSRLALRIDASDDHGVADVTLVSRRRLAGGAEQPEVAQALAAPASPHWSGDPQVDLAARGLQPGDELHVRVVATDNSPWHQTGESRELVLRVPSLSEQRRLVRDLMDSTLSQVNAAARSERALAERTSEAARTRSDRSVPSTESSWSKQRAQDADPRTMSFQSAERARAIAQEQRSLQNQVAAARQSAAELERRMQAAGVLDTSLARQLKDVRESLRDALTPELQRQLDDVMKSVQRLSPEDARQALSSLAQQQQRLRDALERSAEMLRRAGIEGSLQTLHDEARDIAQRDSAVSDSLRRGTGQPGDSSSAPGKAAALGERSRQLARDVTALQQRLQQAQAEAGPRAIEGAPQRADSSGAAMQRSARASSDRAQRAGDARQGAEQMGQVAEQLASARASQVQEWKQELTGQLDQSVQEAMQLARQQERLADRARSGETQGLRSDQSAVQQGVQRLQQRLQAAARQSAHVSEQSQGAMGEARRRVEAATQDAATADRNGPAARTASAMDDAAQALDRAAAQMMKDRARAASAASASGFAEMLQRMRDAAREQGGINARSSGLLPSAGGQPTASMMAEARALARQQRDIARRLEDAGAGEARAEALAREMRQIAAQLDRGQVDQPLLERQQQLFHRLLDAGLTLQKDEQEDTGRRESRAGADSAVVVNGPPVQGRAADRFREPAWNEMRGLTADERRAVIDYFRRLNATHP